MDSWRSSQDSQPLVPLEDGIVPDDDQLFHKGLRDEHPVKRIAVNSRKCGRFGLVFQRDARSSIPDFCAALRNPAAPPSDCGEAIGIDIADEAIRRIRTRPAGERRVDQR